MENKKAPLIFIFITLLVDVIGIGIIIPVIPTLIQQLTGEGLADAAVWGGLLMFSFAIVQFFFAPVLGELSDRFGRRPVLLISLFGLGVDYLFHAFAPTIGWLFVGRLLAGVTGASHTVASAYIADISTKENKAKNFGMVGAAFGLGFIIGPVIGGVCAQWGAQVPFFVAAAITLLNFLFGLFFVPESLPAEKRRPISFQKMIPGVSLAQLGKYAGIGLLIVAFFMANLAGQVMPATWSFFAMEQFTWNEAEVGYSLAAVGMMVAIVQVSLVGWSVKKFGSPKVIMFGFLLWTLGMILISVAFHGWMLYVFLIPYVLGGVAGPTLQSVASNSVSESEQGNLQGSLTSMVSVTLILSLLIYPNVFYLFSEENTFFYFPGAPYVIAALFLLIGSIVAYFALKRIDFSHEQKVKEAS